MDEAERADTFHHQADGVAFDNASSHDLEDLAAIQVYRGT
jgi:hypothetical protein